MLHRFEPVRRPRAKYRIPATALRYVTTPVVNTDPLDHHVNPHFPGASVDRPRVAELRRFFGVRGYLRVHPLGAGSSDLVLSHIRQSLGEE